MTSEQVPALPDNLPEAIALIRQLSARVAELEGELSAAAPASKATAGLSEADVVRVREEMLASIAAGKPVRRKGNFVTRARASDTAP